MKKDHPFKTLIKDTSFVKLWVSQALSQLTINLVNFSILIRIFEVTQSAVAMSLLWVAYSLPALFFAPFSGTIVDLFSRRKMMVVTNLLQALTVALYLFVPAHQVFTLYVLVFAYSFLDQLYLPAQQASVPSLVNKDLLTSANGIFLLTQQFSLIIGFGFGGLFLATIGRSATMALASILLFIAAIAVFLLPRDWANVKRVTTTWEGYLADLKKGYEFVRVHREILYPLILIALAQMFITVVAVILPSYIHNVLGANINFAGVAFVVPGACGALLLTYFLPKILKSYRKKKIIEMGFLTAGISLYGLALLSFAGPFKMLMAVIISVGMGMSIASVMVPSQTLLQEKTPDWFMGRVYAALNFLVIVATTVPLLISAALADVFGVASMLGITATLILIGLLFVRREGDYVLANGLGI